MPPRTLEVILTARDANLSSTLLRGSAQLDMFEKRAQHAGVATEQAGAKAKQAFTAGFMAVGTGLAFSVAKAAQFDQRMHNVNSLMGASQKQLAGYERQVIGMSRRLPQTANELADGFYQINSSGYMGQQGLKVLNQAATAASAGLTDTETAAEAIVAVLHSYNLQAKDSAAVSDDLFQTVNLGVLSFSDLAHGLGQVVGIASTAHISLKEVGAAVATMTRTGIVPAEAFTSLNQLITRLLKPTVALQKVYDQLGYSSGEAALQQKGLGGVMADLQKYTGGSASKMVVLMGDIRAARGAFAFGAKGGELYTQMLKGMQHDTGETGKVLQEQSKSASYQLKLLENDATAAGIAIGTTLLPYLVDGAQGIQRFLSDLQSGHGAAGQLGRDISGIAHDIGTVLQALAPLAELGAGAAFEGLRVAAEAIHAITSAAADHPEAVKILVGSLLALKAASVVGGGLGKLAGPGGILDGIGARALYARDGVKQAATQIRTAEGVSGKFGTAMRGAGGAVRTTGSALLGLAGGPLGLITAGLLAGAAGWADYNREMSSLHQTNEDFVAQQKKQFDGWKASPKLIDDTTSAFKNQQKWSDKTQKSVSGWSKLWHTVGDMLQHTGPGGIEKGLVQAAGEQGREARYLSTNLKDLHDKGRAYVTTIDLMARHTGMSTDAVRRLGAQSKVSDALVRAASGTYTGAAEATLLMKAHVGSAAEAQAKLSGIIEGQAAKNHDATESQLALANAENTFSDASSTAADRADALGKAIQGLITPGANLQQSVEAWRDSTASIVDLAAKARGVGVDRITGQLSTTTKAGKAASDAIRTYATNFASIIDSMAKAGKPASMMNDVLDKTVDTITAAGQAAGLSKSQIQTMLQSLGVDKKTIQIAIKESGGDVTKKKLQNVNQEITKVPKELRIQAQVLAQNANKDLHGLRNNANSLPRQKDIRVGTPGAKQAALDLVNATRKANGIPPLKEIKTRADTQTAIGNLQDLRTKVEDLPGKHTTELNAIDNALATIRRIQQAINDVPTSKSTTITTNYNVVRTETYQVNRHVTPIYGPRADGGIDIFADGGVRGARLPKQAIIAKAHGRNGLIQWAEDSTGGEAFIPLGAAKRERSTDILAEVARRFGYRLTAMASGGMTAYQAAQLAERNTRTRPDSVNAYRGLTAYQRQELADRRRSDAAAERRSKREAEQRAREAAQRAKEAAARAKERRQEHSEWLAYNRRLRQPIALEPTTDLSSLLGDVSQRAEQIAQNQAELHARLTPNKHDTAEDYYKAPKLRVYQYTAALNESKKRTERWRDDLGKIARVAGADVAYQLQQMGDAGIDIVTKMASGTKSQLRAAANALRSWAGTARDASTDFQFQMKANTATSAQFNKDLVTLLGRGQVQLAAYLKNLGADEGGLIARRAVANRGAMGRLSTVVRQANAAALDENLGKALDLAGLLAAAKSPIGITGLANSSGSSVADVWSLLAQYNGQVFSRLAGNRMATVRLDQRLASAGKPLTGLAEGAIVRSNNTAAYRWAEPSSGGESLIPLGQRQRSRALALWRETGRLIGQQTTAPVTVVNNNIAARAVQVNMPINGSNLRPDQIQAIAEETASNAIGQLTARIRAGSR